MYLLSTSLSVLSLFCTIEVLGFFLLKKKKKLDCFWSLKPFHVSKKQQTKTKQKQEKKKQFLKKKKKFTDVFITVLSFFKIW